MEVTVCLEMTLADQAESYWREQGNKIPQRSSKIWKTMFEVFLKPKKQDNKLVFAKVEI